MKRIVLTGLLFALPAFAGQNTYEVSITNLTKGQPLTPAVIAIHAPSVEIFSLGEPASEGLTQLAEDAETAELNSELEANSGVVRTVVGDGVILPGQTKTYTVEANNPKFRLSVVSMLGRTNDAFAGARSLPLYLKRGQSYSRLMKVYDAGTEENNEDGDFIPAPPFGNPGVRAEENAEGFVAPHPGIQNIGDLEPLRDAFAGHAAKITIKRN